MSKKRKLIVSAVVVLGLVFAAFLLPVRGWLIEALEWTEGLGAWGPIVVAAFYIVACVLLLPGSVITLGAGLLFGVLVGTITVSIGSTLGACAAFLVGRTVARDWVSGKVSKNEKFSAIDNAVGEQGLKIVLLTRLSPVFPFNLLNYAYGLTKIPFWQYAIASWVGMLPGTVMYVYFGAGLRSFAELATGEVEGGPAQRIFFWFGLVATIVVTVFVTRIAQKTLRREVPRTAVEPESSEVAHWPA
jgi:uncharacterized membrane protein YdjX (TVP38/TMEM64 family)